MVAAGFVLLAVCSPFIWLASWPEGHPITSWIGVTLLVLVGLAAAKQR